MKSQPSTHRRDPAVASEPRRSSWRLAAPLALTLGAGVLFVRARQTHHSQRRLRRRLASLACLAGAVVLAPSGGWLIGVSVLALLVAPVPPSRPGGTLPRRRPVQGQAALSKTERPVAG